MKKNEIVRELQHYLNLYSINKDEEYLTGILIYSSMLAGIES